MVTRANGASTIREFLTNFTQHIPPPCHEEVRVIHADDDVLVVSKPSGLLSVPGRFLKDCAVNRLVFDYPDVAVVHRLDLDTSGLMVFALTKHAARDLSRQFREREVDKTYSAVVWGEVALDAGEIDLPLGPVPVGRPRHRVDLEHGKQALTRYQVIERCAGFTLMDLKPVTGRSHQLRVHLTHLGHPIIGCDLYAHPAAFNAAPRLMLHAATLEFGHPSSGRRTRFDDPSGFSLASLSS